MESSSREMSEHQSHDATNPGNANDNVDRIRDILFGAQMRDHDTLFQRKEGLGVEQTFADLARRMLPSA